MTPTEHEHLIDFLAKKFSRIDERFDGIDGRLDGLANRMDGLENRMDGLANRMDGLANRMDGLENRMGGLENRMVGVEGRLGGVENRIVGVEVGQESLRTDLQTIAELVTANGRRIDENRQAIEVLAQKVDLNTVAIRAVRDRVAALEDHLRAV